jgi:hypothetical protein
VGPESITPNRGYGFRVRSLSDKIDFVNFEQSSRPGMTIDIFRIAGIRTETIQAS